MKLLVLLLLCVLFCLVRCAQADILFADDDEQNEIRVDLARVKRDADAEPRRGGGSRGGSRSRSYRSYRSYRSRRRTGAGGIDNASANMVASLNLMWTVVVSLASAVAAILYLRADH